MVRPARRPRSSDGDVRAQPERQHHDGRRGEAWMFPELTPRKPEVLDPTLDESHVPHVATFPCWCTAPMLRLAVARASSGVKPAARCS